MLVYKLSKIVAMTDRELYQYCQDVGAKARDWKKRFVALLPEVAKRNLHRKYGFASIVDFAGRLGGVGEYTVESVLRIQKYIEDKPALIEALPKVGVHKLRLIATIATKENQEILAKKVQEMSKSALEVWAREIRPGTEIAKGIIAGKGLSEGQIQLFGNANGFENFSNMSSVDEHIHYSFDVDKNTDFKLRKYKLEMEKAIKRYATWCEVMQKLIKDEFEAEAEKNINTKKTDKRSDAKSAAEKKPLVNLGVVPARGLEPAAGLETSAVIVTAAIGATEKKKESGSMSEAKSLSEINLKQNETKTINTTRYISAEAKREIQNKYQGMCGYPGCNKPSSVLHHTKRFALSPNHENIIPLCSEHHEIVHNGWIKNETDSPEKWLKGLYEGINKAKEKVDQRVRLFSNYINRSNNRNNLNNLNNSIKSMNRFSSPGSNNPPLTNSSGSPNTS